MAKLLTATRGAQYVKEIEFAWNFDDTMVNTSGVSCDMGKTTITSANTFEIAKLPVGATVLGGELVVYTAFDTAAYTMTIGDSTTADRYLASADKKGVARTALTATGYVGTGQNLRMTITNADVCTTGAAVIRVWYTTAGTANEAVS